MGMNAYTERRSLNRHLHEGDVVNHITLAIAKEHESTLLSNIKQFPLVALAISKNILLKKYTKYYCAQPFDYQYGINLVYIRHYRWRGL